MPDIPNATDAPEYEPQPCPHGEPPDECPHGCGADLIGQRYLDLRGRLLDASGLRNIQPPVPLIEQYLYRDSLAWLGGKPGHAKTFVAVDLSCSVGVGKPWHGHTVTQGKVLYLIAEGAAGLSARIDAWSIANGAPITDVLFLPVPVQMMNEIDVAAFTKLLADLRPDLLVLDTQARVTVGAEENSSKDMGRFVDGLERLRVESGACVLVVHHEPRTGENLRGSTALEGAATTILRATKDGNLVEITNPKQKDTPEQPPLKLGLAPLGESAVLSHDTVGIGTLTTESEHHILSVLRESFGTSGATKTELRDAAALTKSTWYRSIKDLVDKGLVRDAPQGRSIVYTLASDNHQAEIPTSPTESHSHPGKSPKSHHLYRGGTRGTPGTSALPERLCRGCGEPTDTNNEWAARKHLGCPDPDWPTNSIGAEMNQEES